MKRLFVGWLLSYLRFYAHIALRKNKPTVIGITGSVGKSTAREMLYAIVKDHFPTKMVYGNSETGIPLGILGFTLDSLGFETPLKSVLDWLRIILSAPFSTDSLKGIQYLIVEMGIDEPDPPKNMEYLLTIVKPDIALFLTVFPGAVHSLQFEKLLPLDQEMTETERVEYLGKAIAEEKAKIITQSNCKTGIYNADNLYVKQSLQALLVSQKGPEMLSFGENKSNYISYNSFAVNEKETTYTFTIKKDEQATLRLKNVLLPEELQQTIAAVIAAALQTGLTPKKITASLEKNFHLPPGRATLLKGTHETTIIDSSYNASPHAVVTFLNLLQTLKKQTKRPIVFLFGDMRELGQQSKYGHELVTNHMLGIVDYLYLVGPQTREYVLPIVQEHESHFKEVRWFNTAARAGEHLKEHLQKNAIILVKGSQNTIFLEEGIKYILQHKEDEQKLCRQERYWLTKKRLTS